MVKQICSIYPISFRADRPLYNGSFILPAGHPDKPVYLEIRDHVQIEPLPWFYANQGASRQPKARHLISAIDIASDLVREWTVTVLGQSPECRPGIWIIRDTMPEYDDEGKPVMSAIGPQETRPATPQERQEMYAEDLAANRIYQATWAEHCIQVGDIMAQKPEAIPFIPDYAKTLCKFYNRDRKWLRALQDGDFKKCPFCRTNIDSEAIVCPQCSRDLTLKVEGKPSPKKEEKVAVPA